MVVLFDRDHLPENIYEIVFATEQQALVAKLLVKDFKEHDNELTRELMSKFATKLHEGKVVINIKEFADSKEKHKRVTVSYNKRQFYDRILTPMKTMGMVDFDMYKKIYKVSTKFKNLLDQIGDMWAAEVNK